MSKIPNAVAKVLGSVMKMAELVGKGPMGLQETPNTVKVYWSVFKTNDMILNFTFDTEDGLKVWEQIMKEPSLSKTQRAYLQKQVGKCFDYGAMKEQMAKLR